MTHFSPAAAARHQQRLAAHFADGLNRTPEPPTFAEVARERGWPQTTDRPESTRPAEDGAR